MIESLVDTEKPRDAVEMRLVVIAMYAGDVTSNLDIGAGIERRQQVELLEDKTDLALAHAGALGVGKLGEVVAIYDHAAGIRARESAKHVEQSGFTAAGWTYDADELSGFYCERDSTHRLHIDLADAVRLFYILNLDNGCHFSLRYYTKDMQNRVLTNVEAGRKKQGTSLCPGGSEAAISNDRAERLKTSLPVGELHAVQPDGVVGHIPVPVHLERDVQFVDARRLWRISPIDVTFFAIHGDGQEFRPVVAGSLELKHHMVPRVCRRRRAGDPSRYPFSPGRVEDIPSLMILDVALRTHNVFVPADRLIGVELKRLRRRGVLDIEVKVVDEILGRAARA